MTVSTVGAKFLACAKNLAGCAFFEWLETSLWESDQLEAACVLFIDIEPKQIKNWSRTVPPIDQMQLSRRERQIMDILLEDGECSAKDVLKKLPDPPSYSSVRALIARLVEKDIVTFRLDGTKHIYAPKITEGKAQQSAVQRLLKIFFRGSRVKAVTALLDAEGEKMTAREIEKIERSIEQLKKAQLKQKQATNSANKK